MTIVKQKGLHKDGKLAQMIDSVAEATKLIKILQVYEAEVPQLKKIATSLQKKLSKKYAANFVVARNMDEGGFCYDAEPDDVKIKVYGDAGGLAESIVEFTGAKYLGKNATTKPKQWHETTVDVFQIPGIKNFLILQQDHLRVELQKTAEIRFTNFINGRKIVVEKTTTKKKK